MKSITALPEAVTHYLAAANRLDAAFAADCFTPDAIVHDENQEHVGRDAIRLWIEDTGRKYRPTSTLIQSSVHGNEVRINVAVSGQFPGSPVDLNYNIRLRDGKIAALGIE